MLPVLLSLSSCCVHAGPLSWATVRRGLSCSSFFLIFCGQKLFVIWLSYSRVGDLDPGTPVQAPAVTAKLITQGYCPPPPPRLKWADRTGCCVLEPVGLAYGLAWATQKCSPPPPPCVMSGTFLLMGPCQGQAKLAIRLHRNSLTRTCTRMPTPPLAPPET